MKLVILGNGILALTSALRFVTRAPRGAEVVIVGRRSRPGSATLAAAAMLNSFAELEEGALDSEVARFRFELSRLATRLWPAFLRDELPAAAGSLGFGTYVINNTSADDLDDVNFRVIVAALEEHGEPFTDVDPAGIPNYSPAPRHRAVRAIQIPAEGWINPRVVTTALDDVLARTAGVSVIDDEAVRLVAAGGRIDHVVLSSGSHVSGDQYLVATGATTGDLMGESRLGLTIPRLFYGVGVSLEILSPEHPHTHCIRTPNRGLACGLYTVPYVAAAGAPSHSILVGATNHVTPAPQPSARVVAVQTLLTGAMEQVNAAFYRASLVRVNVGWRPTSADLLPVLGRTSIANLTLATGTRRDGFHLAPVLSTVIASMVLGDPVDERFAWFRPERPLVRTLSRARAIELGVRHQASAAYQHGFTPAHSRLSEQLQRMYADDLERLHDAVGAVDWGIPPELTEMYRYGHIAGSASGWLGQGA